MANRRAGKVALIPGAARGLAAADARLFVVEGAKVVLGDVLDKKGQELAKQLNQGAKTGPAVYMHLDVTKATDWENAVVVAEREFEHLSILLNNAALLSIAGVEDTTEEQWQWIVDVNQKGGAAGG